MRPLLSILHVPRDVLAVLPLLAAAAFGSRALLALQHDVYRQSGLDNFGTTNPVLEILANASAFTLLALVLPVGALVDRLGSHRLFMVGSALAATGTAIGAIAAISPLLLTGRFLATSGFTVTGATALAYVVRRTPERHRGRALGLASATTPAGSLLAQAVTEVGGTGGWRVVLLLTTVATLAGLALAQRYAVVVEPPHAPDFRLRHLVYTPNRLILVNLTAIAVGVTFTSGWILLLQADLDSGTGLGQTRLPSVVGQLPNVVWAVAVGALSDRVGRLRVLVPSALTAGIVSVLAFNSGDAAMYALFTLALSLGSGAVLMIQLMVVDRAAPSRLGAALATYNFIRIIGLMLVTPILGLALNALSSTPAVSSILILPAAAVLVAVLAIAAGETRSTHPPRPSDTGNAA